jgi:SAM-dependent methyltransferase
MATSNRDTFFNYLIGEYHHPFNGWDFSYLNGRRVDLHQQHHWDYAQIVTSAMKEAQSMLDMRTGGGERLAQYLAIQPVPEVYATEGYAPNVSAARQRLAALGVTVYEVQDDQLPLPDASLDLVINRHGSYKASEVRRVLKPGKYFITQQVGDQTNHRLHELLGSTPSQNHPVHPGTDEKPAWNLASAVGELEAGGWQIREQQEEFYPIRYYDVGAIVYYLKAIPWVVPGFTVERFFDQLVEIRDLIEQDGFLDVLFHQFLIVAQRSL